MSDDRTDPRARAVESRSLAARERALEEGLRDMQAQLELAGRLQRDLLTGPIPEVRGARIAALFRPASLLSGDLFRVQRIGDTHVAITLIDPTGHGLPAAMLSMYTNALVEAGGSRGAANPAALLDDLNRALVESQLEDCFFLAALHAVYDESTRIIRWARGGVPYPILSRAAGLSPRDPHRAAGFSLRGHGESTISRIESVGGLVGAVADTQFEVTELQLEPGDRIVFHTDGLDALLLGADVTRMDATPMDHPWVSRLHESSLQSRLDTLDEKIDATPTIQWQTDDVTVVALEVLHEAV
ncbi:MAG: SpoIIE family protein phosphatase [Planctomycetes bacterium]|nr:SpoIIE family protein phosphatase [Planctomycetota bacterium]